MRRASSRRRRGAAVLAAVTVALALCAALPAAARAGLVPGRARSTVSLSSFIHLLKAPRSSISQVVFDPDRREAEAQLRGGGSRVTVYPDDAAQMRLQTIAQREGISFSATPVSAGGPSGMLVPLLVLAAAGGAAVLLLRRRAVRSPHTAGGHAGGTTLSRQRRKRALGVRCRFTDVAGIDEAVAELAEVRDYLADPGRFKRLGARIPKGVLLVGPPGTGKTLLARAVAGEAGVPFLHASGSEFVEMYVGVGARRIRELFGDARNAAPAIVFIDEIDAVGRRRSGHEGGSAEGDQTLNQLLVEMDGFDVDADVIVMAATNRVDVLDPALVRPGRFDRQIVVDAPDRAGRRKILEVHAADKPLDGSVSLDGVAAATPGFTGADLANVLNEAALIAARERRARIGSANIEDAVLRVLAGPERPSRIIAESERRVTAYHEVGHALVAHLLAEGHEVHRISIVGRGRSLGMTVTLPEVDRCLHGHAYMLAQMAAALGGRAAEELVFAEVTSGAADDLRRATAMAEQIVKCFGMSDRVGLRVLVDGAGGTSAHSERLAAAVDEEIRALLEGAYATAAEVLSSHREALDEVARVLLAEETLSGDRLTALLERHAPRPGVPRALAG
jgi:cell division protease FtsH